MGNYKFDIDFILSSIKGKLLNRGGKSYFNGVSIDSRSAKKTDIFIALKGERFDGHDFIDEALRKGVKCLIVDRVINDKCNANSVSVIKVKDTSKALYNLAMCYRKLKKTVVVGITGSSGKTTTKEIISSVLNKRYSVLKTEGNLNNLIGLPLTLLKLKNEEVAVVEMGTNSFGEIPSLVRIASPDIAVITNIGEAHLEKLISLEGVASEKGKIFAGLKPDGIAVLNGDDPYIARMIRRIKKEKLVFGLTGKADISAEKVQNFGIKGQKFVLKTPEGKIGINLKIQGKHNLYNAVAASAVCHALNVPLISIKKGLEGYKPYKMRFEILPLKKGIYIVNDCYNANPSSMKAALETVSVMAERNRKVAVLGDMKELGNLSKSAHKGIGILAAKLGFEKLFLFGNDIKFTAEGALSAGLKKRDIFLSDDKSKVIMAIISGIKNGDWILIKGSRAMKLEEITKSLKEKM